jgi:hypothetical protein
MYLPREFLVYSGKLAITITRTHVIATVANSVGLRLSTAEHTAPRRFQVRQRKYIAVNLISGPRALCIALNSGVVLCSDPAWGTTPPGRAAQFSQACLRRNESRECIGVLITPHHSTAITCILGVTAMLDSSTRTVWS